MAGVTATNCEGGDPKLGDAGQNGDYRVTAASGSGLPSVKMARRPGGDIKLCSGNVALMNRSARVRISNTRTSSTEIDQCVSPRSR
jgi:hypothetical protein